MKEQEFRIGNLVFVDNTKYHPAVKDIPLEVMAITPNLDSNGWTYSISLKHINQKPNTYYETYSQFLKWIKPIPLTEEWLEKFGFKKYHTQTNEHIYTLGIFEYADYYPEITLEIEGPEGSISHETGINTVHQLQNLYFALTGEELTIKE